MNLSLQQFESILRSGAKRVIDAQDELTQIDSRFGDADHGVTMTKISNSILKAMESDQYTTVHALLDAIATAVMFVNGGSAAPLWATMLEGMSKGAPKSKSVTPQELKAIFGSALTSLFEITTARVGDKTMMDALIPAVQAIEAAQGDCTSLLLAGSEAAKEGSVKSAEFVSKFGRAKSYGEKTIGTPDAGAVSMRYFFTGLYEGLV